MSNGQQIGNIVGAGLSLIAAGYFAKIGLDMIKETQKLAMQKRIKTGNKYIDRII